MCGINGISKRDETLIEAMNRALQHRGPDGTAVTSNNHATLGHNRLAIIDLNESAGQPMTGNSGRYSIVFNGEIYNFKELQKELSYEYAFKTQGDTEVLLAAYERWGETMLHKLRGIFAFALVDNSNGDILLVRDQMGVKPLYYSFENKVLTFSSELSGMVSAGHRTLNKSAAGVYMSMQYVPSPLTLVEGVKKLQPGELLRFSKGAIETEMYHTTIVLNPEENEEREMYDVIKGAVQRQMISDREVGLFLSGGLDSSVVLHHAQELSSKIRTFALGFELDDNSTINRERFNYDVEAAAKTAACYGVNHHSFTLTHDDIEKNLISSIEALDEPVANPTAFTKYMLSKWVRESGVVVALGGDGGDEMFMGYPRHQAVLAAEYFQRAPQFIQKMLATMHPRFAKLALELGPHFHAKMLYNDQPNFSKVWKGSDPFSEIEKICTEKYVLASEKINSTDAFVTTDARMWLPDESLHTSDRASMAHGLEYRVPLLDLDIVYNAKKNVRRRHMSLRTGKKMLRSEYYGKLPKHLFEAKKRGWQSPAAKWLRNDLIKAQVTEIMSDEYYNGLSSVIDWNAAQGMLKDHIDRRSYALYPIWNLFQLQVWCKKNGITE